MRVREVQVRVVPVRHVEVRHGRQVDVWHLDHNWEVHVRVVRMMPVGVVPVATKDLLGDVRALLTEELGGQRGCEATMHEVVVHMHGRAECRAARADGEEACGAPRHAQRTRHKIDNLGRRRRYRPCIRLALHQFQPCRCDRGSLVGVIDRRVADCGISLLSVRNFAEHEKQHNIQRKRKYRTAFTT